MTLSNEMLPQRELDFAAKAYANLAVVLLIPISVTIVVVVWGVTNLTPIYGSAGGSPVYLARDENTATTTTDKVSDSVINALVIVAVITGMTFLMVLLYKCNCQRILIGWLLLSAGMVFFFMFWIWLDLLATRFQIPYDFVSIAFIQWNFGVVGILSVFYYAHAKLTQAYLIMLSVILGWMLTRLPEWSAWMILVFVAIYDVVAVLGSKGPLRMLVEEAQKRQEPLPGFIYDSESAPQHLLSENAATAAASQPRQPSTEDGGATERRATDVDRGTTPQQPGSCSATAAPSAGASSSVEVQASSGQTDGFSDEEDEEGGNALESAASAHSFKLGLGDFIFYSVLVGKASQYSYVSWIFSYFCVTMGLVGTLTSLVFLRGKVPALPALPISIFLAVFVFFVSKYTAVPLLYSFAATGYAI